jgi:hypothetical protein
MIWMRGEEWEVSDFYKMGKRVEIELKLFGIL